MATENKKDVTGLETAAAELATENAKGTSMRDVEYDLTTALLSAAEFRTSEDAIKEVEIKRGGKFFFSVRVHPISDTESRKARRRATTMMANPNNKKLPPIEKEFNSALFHSQVIYLATVEEDREKIWGNKKLMEKYDILDPVDTIDVLLAVGEKLELVDIIMDISGLGGDVDETTPEDYAKN
jgi:hypothetical protein